MEKEGGPKKTLFPPQLPSEPAPAAPLAPEQPPLQQPSPSAPPLQKNKFLNHQMCLTHCLQHHPHLQIWALQEVHHLLKVGGGLAIPTKS